MILVTVGTQLPFDRLVRAVDEWAGKNGRTDVVAQIGRSSYKPRNLKFYEALTPSEFDDLLSQADFIVSHAGIGTIIGALDQGKPIVVMPRMSKLKEQRTDHQIATADKFGKMKLVMVAQDEQKLATVLDQAINNHKPPEVVNSKPDSDLLSYVTNFIESGVNARTESQPDGIICFGGEDWWYHNRGHYDMQMMREASKRLPVLYINSIGVRSPSRNEGAVFFKRVFRKSRSFLRGLVRVRPSHYVYSPITSPGIRTTRIGRWLTVLQIRATLKRVGIRKPLVWIALPTAADLIDTLPNVGIIYQRTDRFEEFSPENSKRLKAQDLVLKKKANATLFCSHYLMEAEKQECTAPFFVDHGVDYQQFRLAGLVRKEPEDMRAIPRPRIGFVGGVDSHTFNAELFCEVVKELPEYSFVIVGAISLQDGWCRAPNLWLLGKKPYNLIADYMAACDVLIMPWNDNEWIRSCNPVKLKEYLATGRPVVSTPFPELEYYQNQVAVATPSEFVKLLRRVVVEGQTPVPTNYLASHTWKEKFLTFANEILPD